MNSAAADHAAATIRDSREPPCSIPIFVRYDFQFVNTGEPLILKADGNAGRSWATFLW
jgi:hypothetical protein